MSNKFYKQCRLQKGNTHQVVWIPQEFAKAGKIVGIKKGDEWDEGWEVTNPGTDPVEAKLIENQSHNSNNIWKPSTLLTNRGNK
jgi:hypothetical protein